MAFNSATENFESRAESSQKLTSSLSTEALFTQSGNDLYRKAISASLNFASTCDLPSCDDLLKQFGDTKTQPLYDKTEKGAKPSADETPKLKSWDEAIKGKEDDVLKPKSWDEATKQHKSDHEKHHKPEDGKHHKPDAGTHHKGGDGKHHKAVDSRQQNDDTVTVTHPDGSSVVYKPNGEVKHYPKHALPGNAALEDWLE